MERIIEVERYPDDQQSLGTSGRTSVAHNVQSKKPPGKFKQERHSFTYGEIHHETAKSANDSPWKASRNHHHDRILGKMTKKDEIVKYMSNLPSYLERGERVLAKVRSVGVLDWGRLEKWQCGDKRISRGGSWNPPVRCNGSSSSSTDGSSPQVGKDHTSSSCERLHRSSLYSHLLASPHSQFVKSFGEGNEKCHGHEFCHNNTSDGQGKVVQKDQHSCKNNQEVKIKHFERKDPETKIHQECRTLPDGLNYEVPSSQCREFTGLEKSQARCSVANGHDILEKPEAVVPFPSNLRQNNYKEVSKLSNSTSLLSQKSEEANQKSFMERSMVRFPVELKSDIPNSSKTSGEINRQQFLLKQNCYTNISNTPNSVSRSATAGFSPSEGRVSESSVVTPLNSVVKEASSGLDLTASTVTVEKVRSSSPFSRLSIGMGRRRKSSSSMGHSRISDQGSTHVSVKSGSENAMPSARLNDSSNGKPSSKGRASSSPLRRLLDPLLKPKASVCHHAAEPFEIDKNLNEMASKAYSQQSDSSTVQARKLKLDMSSCRKINVNDSSLDTKHGPSLVQGLLQISFKNGLPLFTFAVDNVSNILAATMKVTSSGKEKSRHIYTFFSVQEAKKKNGNWITQGSRGKDRDYVSNVIAQMKVSEPQISHLTKPDEPSLREFVLISVNLKQSDQHTSEFQPNEELAAIVVKIPQKTKQNIGRDEFQRNAYGKTLDDGHRECFSGVKSFACSEESVQVRQPTGSETYISTTVLLPSGVHSLPSKGGPSSLIERWNSGGSCDCGGWDLGCKLRILANQNQAIGKSSSSEHSPMMNQFKLFPQEGVPENHCFLSLSTFKDAIYSVEFHSSLSLLQAFSICLAMIDSKHSCELSESSILFEAKTTRETKLVQNDRLRTRSLAERAIPTGHAIHPPLSPFGRV